MSPKDRFEGKSAIVTGAARGIGEATARLLLEEGADVHAIDCNGPLLLAWARSLGDATAERMHTYAADICDEIAIRKLIGEIHERAPIDCLVNSAGVLDCASFLEISSPQWHHIFKVNTYGTFLMIQTVAEKMVHRRRGSIVTVASNAAGTPRSNMAAYCASKAAVRMLTQCAGLELGRYGVRCNIVSPGSTDTPMLNTLKGTKADRDAWLIAGEPALFRGGIPLQKIATPQDVAESIAFLLSDQANHITIRELVVDGGATF